MTAFLLRFDGAMRTFYSIYPSCWEHCVLGENFRTPYNPLCFGHTAGGGGLRLPIIIGTIKAVSILGMLPLVKSNSLRMMYLSKQNRGSLDPKKEKGCRERFYTTNTRASTTSSRDMISCSSSDLYLKRLLPLPSKVTPMTGFRRRGQNLDTYSTAQCRALHPVLFSAFQPACALESTGHVCSSL